jgi:hypothetical protein
MIDNDMPLDWWLAIRKEAALKIDPKTAEVFWDYREGARAARPLWVKS